MLISGITFAVDTAVSWYVFDGDIFLICGRREESRSREMFLEGMWLVNLHLKIMRIIDAVIADIDTNTQKQWSSKLGETTPFVASQYQIGEAE